MTLLCGGNSVGVTEWRISVAQVVSYTLLSSLSLIPRGTSSRL